MSLLSPSVNVREIDLSLTVSNASSSFGVFCGLFKKGPAAGAVLIDNITDLENTYGKPTNDNYNDFFQAYCFLRNAGSLYVSRAVDTVGKAGRKVAKGLLTDTLEVGVDHVDLSDVSDLYPGAKIMFGENMDSDVYIITEIKEKTVHFTPEIQAGGKVTANSKVYICNPSMNAIGEVLKSTSTAQPIEFDLEKTKMVILNDNEYEANETSIKFSSNDVSLKFIAKSVGDWGNDIRVAVGNPDDFAKNKELVEGVSLADNFQYAPQEGQVAIVVMELDQIKETFLVSLDPNSKDFNNKSDYIETVLNRKSSYVYCKHNTAVKEQPKSALGSSLIKLKFGEDGNPTAGDIANCYTENFLSKEEIDVDIIIANEKCIRAVADFCKLRGDVIGYGSATYDQLVGFKADKCVSNLIEYRQKGDLNIDNKYFSFIGNYGYIYDKYNDKYRWISLAGSSAGLRAATNSQRYPWFASAGLNQGQYVDILKLAFSPNQGQRDLLYKNSINPVVSFPAQGICLWGQKTCTSKPSAFDRVNVRMLFNYLERNIAKSARYILFEQNTTTTQNMFVSMTTPLLDYCKAASGIDAFKVVCDDSNNTPLVKSNNQFVASFLIKPTYAIEYINLNFVALGATISFEEAAGSI